MTQSQKKSIGAMSENVKKPLDDGIWKIERYGSRESDGWNEIKAKNSNMYLLFKNLSLALIHDDTLLELISFVTNDVRMVFRNDSLGIAIIRDGIRLRKIRLKFAGMGLFSGAVVGRNCAAILRNYVKVDDISTNTASTAESPNLSFTVPKLLSELLNPNGFNFDKLDNNDFSSSFPLEEMIEFCILDPEFPSFVAQVSSTLNKKLK